MSAEQHEQHLPRDSDALSDWALHCYTNPESEDLTDQEKARRLQIARTALAGIEELLAAGEINDVTLTFAVPGDDGEAEFTFSA